MSESNPGRAVAVIDIGSNSIKLLVAARAGDGSLVSLAESTEETRIGTGLTGNPPRLHSDAMERAVESVKQLLCEANRFQPWEVCIVATSAIRDAVNQAGFAAFVDDATNHELRILSGLEEAAYVARGVRCDPRRPRTDRFHLFDLGGGSLELLALDRDEVMQLVSLPLGCVRLTETFISDPAAAIPPATVARLRAHVRGVLQESGFRFDLPAPAPAIVTGGSATTLRAIRAAAAGIPFNTSGPALPVDDLEDWANFVSQQSIEERRQIAGLSAPRADVFPAALWTLLEVAQAAGAESLQHSLCSLRHGVASELLHRPQ